jgi:type IV fimbrial biogenesis protein FimT
MPARGGIAITGNRPVSDYISFTSIGHARRHDGALQMGTLTICRRGQGAQKVVLANSGRVRLDVTGEVCA